MLSAAPGAGKTRPALEFARRDLASGAAGSVLVACPTGPLTRQWARAASRLGVELAVDAPRPARQRGFDGVAVTYARIAKAPGRWERARESATLVIADEAHHLGEELAWGEAFSQPLRRRARWLLLSGTPFRSDATPIPGVQLRRGRPRGAGHRLHLRGRGAWTASAGRWRSSPMTGRSRGGAATT